MSARHASGRDVEFIQFDSWYKFKNWYNRPGNNRDDVEQFLGAWGRYDCPVCHGIGRIGSDQPGIGRPCTSTYCNQTNLVQVRTPAGRQIAELEDYVCRWVSDPTVYFVVPEWLFSFLFKVHGTSIADAEKWYGERRTV